MDYRTVRTLLESAFSDQPIEAPVTEAETGVMSISFSNKNYYVFESKEDMDLLASIYRAVGIRFSTRPVTNADYKTTPAGTVTSQYSSDAASTHGMAEDAAWALDEVLNPYMNSGATKV